MRRRRRTAHSILAVLLVAGTAGLAAPDARAGGPAIVLDGQPVRWARHAVTGPAPLQSQTVDAQGNVLYRVDAGELGPLSNAEAAALVDRIFGHYNGIQTSAIKFANAGPIRHPATGAPIDLDETNVGLVLSASSPTFQNAIVFDADGAITGHGGTLGFFNLLQLTGAGEVAEGIVVLNGAGIDLLGGPVPFTGIFTHEFGHFCGPLDHAQSNGNLAVNGDGSELPPGYTVAQANDLFAPFTETMFPFLFYSPPGSLLGAAGFGDSAYWIASLDFDTRNALSALYPAPGFSATDPGSPNGAIAGRVVIRTTTGDVPVTGVNVVARRIGQGPYYPPPDTQAFPGMQVPLDAFGVPTAPPAQDATDCLATVQSAVTGHALPAGEFKLDGLPPGDYLVEIQNINPYAVSGSRIGPLARQLTLPAQEYYNGAGESGSDGDHPGDFAPVPVAAGAVASGIDIVLNGFGEAALLAVAEREPNDRAARPQAVTIDSEIAGGAAAGDTSGLFVRFNPQLTVPVQDLYRLTLLEPRAVWLMLDPAAGAGDLDLYLFDSSLRGRTVRIDGSSVVAYSAGETATEIVSIHLAPGTYTVGVSSYAGDVQYRLRFIAAE